MRRRSIWNFSICFAALLVLPRAGLACTAEKMKTTDSGFLFKVVGGSDKVAAKIGPGSEETAFVLEVLAPYYVICEDDQFYKITDHAADTVAQAETGKVGYVLRDQVHPWPTREALNFSEISFPGERAEILVWDDEAVLAKFLDTGNQKIGPPAFRLLKREPTERPLPVLSSKTQLMLNSKEKRVFRVLLPAAVVPEGSAEFDGRGAAIPMAPPDSEKVSRLRSSGANLNVDPEQGGILVREGFILDNEDLLEPEIQVDKKTLDGLITLFSALGAAVVDVDHMKESASRALAIIAGERYDPKDSIELTLQKRLGMRFRINLLDFKLDDLAGMNLSERQAITKRFQETAAILGRYLEANLAAFEKSATVWMPVSQLP